ncbi:MAG: DJ-1/PfpI family protein [Bacteroidaceae bacterium]|nr:DJ-1/PfpI family protein [Bacteroidaceae bacterium]
MKVYFFLATGFQETEAIAPLTICRRTELEVITVSVTGNLLVESALGVTVKADVLFEDIKDFSDATMLVMPGGMPGSTNLRDCRKLDPVIRDHFAAGKPLAAICAAPIVYGSKGLLKGRRATCYPGNEGELEGATYTGAQVEIDGQFITGKGPGSSLRFGYAIVEYLLGKETVDAVKKQMMYE